MERGDNVYFEHTETINGSMNYQVVSADDTTYKRNHDYMRQTGVNIKIRDKSPQPPIQSEQEQQMGDEHIENEIKISDNQNNLRPRREIKSPS